MTASQSAWVLRIPRHEEAGVAELRLVKGIEVLETQEAIWLRGSTLERELELRLRCIPGAELFSYLDAQRLVPQGKRVPAARLPSGAWSQLAQHVRPAWPTPALPARNDGARRLVPIRLVRGGEALEPNVLVASLADWTAFAAVAPWARLEPLSFAADTTGRVVLRGRPLPSLPGQRWVERDGIVVPCGFVWSPAVDAPVVRELLGLPSGALALFTADSGWELIEASSFVAATRSAARRTLEEVLRG